MRFSFRDNDERALKRALLFSNIFRNVKKIEKFNYQQLLELQNESKEEYLRMLMRVHSVVQCAIQKKAKKGKVKVAFVSSFLATWTLEKLFLKMREDDRFDVQLFLVWQKNSDKEKEIGQLSEYFDRQGIPYTVATEDTDLKGTDIVFFTSPYLNLLEGKFDLKDIPLTTLVCYCAYSFLLAKLETWQFDLPIHNVCWRNYIYASFYKEMGEKYCSVGSYGMVFSGNPGMDRFYEEDQEFQASELWKRPELTKIIWAPHHSIDAEPYVSTFALNHKWFLEYARTHADTTTWIVKPHPLLAISSVSSGVFKTQEEWKRYIQEWNSLPNARVLDGTYIDLFKTSDCMILDSISFKAEYMYTHKPQLFLLRNDRIESENDFGKKVSKYIYQVNGEDFAGIMNFIENKSVTDPEKPEREAFFEKYLDYYKVNGMTATEKIYDDLLGALWKKQ